MKLTARIDYAILALFELALQGRDRRVQARTLAERQKIPRRFLEQILIQLKRAGLVKSVRGASGGYLLARLPSEITLKEVVEAVEGELGTGPRRSHPPSHAPVLKVWREIEEEFVRKLESITIQDLIHRKIREDRVIVFHI